MLQATLAWGVQHGLVAYALGDVGHFDATEDLDANLVYLSLTQLDPHAKVRTEGNES